MAMEFDLRHVLSGSMTIDMAEPYSAVQYLHTR